MVLLLVNKIATKASFCNYTYLDEMKSLAYYNVWKNLSLYDPEKSKYAFAYFTKVVLHSFFYILNKEKQIINRKNEYNEYEIDKIYLNSELNRYAKKVFTQEIKETNKNYYD